MTRNERHYITEMMIDYLDRFGRTPTKEEIEKALANFKKV